MNYTDRLQKLEDARRAAKADVEDARACGVTFTAKGPIFYSEALAILRAIEFRISELDAEAMGDAADAAYIPVSDLIDSEDRF